ncbi:helix-turn-helix domain-containing protein [Pseudomonas mosselii]|uniref:helix-turn-helix domain-containing protein n=1 Tax=Pseudomonas mosselii TaxID=78327 RepID=UPI0021DA9C9D|nr:helix-turn-helix transcriptional regulator [Pseudomonas mosselii]MCU9528382.1 helix-turn-helix domain-containing protein [Pseudomonas mosselii]MCU9535556.1 helix-turn-helix domain-containing protein [Pseudomonas mosselii]MCU9547406.1 helix-turn-helix domain-containing protein [Pseudomonas mosselii]
MEIRESLGEALRRMRIRHGLTQEDFGVVSSRTYVSTLERGLKSPTIQKIEELAGRTGVHPLSLIVSAYLIQDPDVGLDSLINQVRKEALKP